MATSAQILTSNPEELTAENITAAAQIANTLLLSPNATEVRTVKPNSRSRKSCTLKSNACVTLKRYLTVTVLMLMFVPQSVRVAAVATVSQLLNASAPDDGTQNNATLG